MLRPSRPMIAPLHVVAAELDDGDGVLDGVGGGRALDGREDDLARLAVGRHLGLVADLFDGGRGLQLGLVLQLLDEPLERLVLRDARDGFELADVLADEAVEADVFGGERLAQRLGVALAGGDLLLPASDGFGELLHTRTQLLGLGIPVVGLGAERVHGVERFLHGVLALVDAFEPAGELLLARVELVADAAELGLLLLGLGSQPVPFGFERVARGDDVLLAERLGLLLRLVDQGLGLAGGLAEPPPGAPDPRQPAQHEAEAERDERRSEKEEEGRVHRVRRPIKTPRTSGLASGAGRAGAARPEAGASPKRTPAYSAVYEEASSVHGGCRSGPLSFHGAGRCRASSQRPDESGCGLEVRPEGWLPFS